MSSGPWAWEMFSAHLESTPPRCGGDVLIKTQWLERSAKPFPDSDRADVVFWDRQVGGRKIGLHGNHGGHGVPLDIAHCAKPWNIIGLTMIFVAARKPWNSYGARSVRHLLRPNFYIIIIVSIITIIFDAASFAGNACVGPERKKSLAGPWD